jgi:hypothetical protein
LDRVHCLGLNHLKEIRSRAVSLATNAGSLLN